MTAADAREFPPDAESVSAARRFVASALSKWNRHDLAEAATLLTSELVTNAVLHAGTEVRLVVSMSESCLRVEVHDKSTVVPALKRYAPDAATGRGLHLVEMVADAWGVEHNEDKCVWFELRPQSSGETASAPMEIDLDAWPDLDEPVAASPELREVRLEGIPLDVWKRSREHGDALTREFLLISGSRPEDRESVPARLLALVDDITARFQRFTMSQDAQLTAAAERGEQRLDLAYHVPSEVTPAARDLRDMLAEADAYCRAGQLITLASPPDIVRLRNWFLEEFERQIGGEPPRPWSEVAGA